MSSLNSLAKEPKKSSLTSGLKWKRRSDLTPLSRLKIASEALCFSRWGTITRLAEQYALSRAFIYDLKSKLKAHASNIFESPKVSPPSPDLSGLSQILQLRLVGRCSLSSISELLSSHSTSCSSIGWISGQLQEMGERLGNQIAWSGETIAATDELYYSGHRPILVSVDVASGAILKAEMVENFGSPSWQQHLESLQASGIKCLKIISDEGNVMAGGRKLLPQPVTWQPDTFHAVSGRLGAFKTRIAKQLQGARALEANRATLFWATQSEVIRLKAFTQWEKALESIEKIKLLQSQFLFLYGCIQKQFTLFRGTDAHLRERSFAEGEVQTALELLKTLEIKGLEKELNALEKTLPVLFSFLDFTKEHLPEWEATQDPLAVPYWKRAWQAAKIAAKIKQNYPKQQLWKAYSLSDLKLLEDFYPNGDSFEDLKRTIFKQLDTICAQASSPVETANSFLRPFINQSRDQIQQHTLNLLLFYYNHRTLQRGKNKGFSPMQILTGEKNTEGWLPLMLKFASVG
jgi:hypothetical protein